MSAGTLFDAPLSVVNVGLEHFLAPIRAHGTDAVGVRWRPPESAPLPVSERRRLEALTDVPNRRALDRMLASRPFLVDVRPAREVIPELADGLILHAGPPIEWERMIGPMRGAVIGALQFEGLAGDAETAEALAGSGRIRFAPNHHHAAVGPMAGITCASMPVWVVENRTFGNRAHANLNEGLGKVLRYGAFAAPVIERLRWTADVLAPSLARALDNHGPLDLTALAAEALSMGDELHNRNRAATSLFTRRIAATDLEATLRNRGIESLWVTGVTTEVCVTTTVREANDRGFECLVLEDCVGSYFPEFQRAALDMIKAQGGIFGWVARSAPVLQALEGA